MKTHHFSLDFVLPAQLPVTAEDLERLAQENCTDALVGIGRPGRIVFDFDREDGDARTAVLSALGDVGRAMPEAELIEASPDYVGLTDIAELLRMTRQNARKVILGPDSSAPPPVHRGNPSLWHLAPLLEWLRDSKGYAIDDHLIALAWTTLELNSDVASRALTPTTA